MTQIKSFSVFFLFKIFVIFYRPKIDSKILDADVGPQRPTTLRPYDRRQLVAAGPAPRDESAEVLAELESHLERLTGDMPETTIDDIPLRLQRYVIGVSGPFRRFLCKVARAVVSYRDHHQ